MPYPDDFNRRAFDARHGETPEYLRHDYDYIESRADAILDEMVMAVRSVVAKHGLSFFHESEDALKATLYEEFLYRRVKVSQDAIEEAGYPVPEPKYVTVARMQDLRGIAPAEEGNA